MLLYVLCMLSSKTFFQYFNPSLMVPSDARLVQAARTFGPTLFLNQEVHSQLVC